MSYIQERIKEVADKNNGGLPHGSLTMIATELGVTKERVRQIAEKYGYKTTQKIKQDTVKEVQQLKETASTRFATLDEIRITLCKLEGAIAGITPFHPKLGTYMMEQVNKLYRLYYNEENGAQARLDILSGESKKGWEDIDREIMKNDIVDNKIARSMDEKE